MGLLDFIYRQKFPGLLSAQGPFSQVAYQRDENERRYNPESNASDGPVKGPGYFGALVRPDGQGLMTEYGVGMEILGKEMEIPTLVPTLSPEEVMAILKAKEGEKLPNSIYRKAAQFAQQRVARGLSPWAGPHEEGQYFNLLRGK